MRVTLRSEIFAAPMDHTLLITLFRYAIDGRHRVEADLSNVIILDWLNTQSSRVQDEIRFAIDFSCEAEALEPSATWVEVSNFAADDWNTNPLKIRIDHARQLLDTAFSLLLEDAHSDKAFLMKMLTLEERKFVEQLIEKGFLRIEHGGGLGNMARYVSSQCNNPAARYTTWVLFDSDSMSPGMPSKSSQKLKGLCAGYPHYQLKRRFIESYLPSEALHAWASKKTKPNTTAKRFKLIKAYTRMCPDQRHHYNMKGGFSGDQANKNKLAEMLYANLNAQDKILLDNGFGNSISTMFEDPSVSEVALRKNSGWSELRPAVTELLARVR